MSKMDILKFLPPKRIVAVLPALKEHEVRKSLDLMTFTSQSYCVIKTVCEKYLGKILDT